MTLAQLEHRLARLEREFAAMSGKSRPSSSQGVNSWIDEIHGTFEDDESYRAAARLGREWRAGKRALATRRRKASGK